MQEHKDEKILADHLVKEAHQRVALGEVVVPALVVELDDGEAVLCEMLERATVPLLVVPLPTELEKIVETPWLPYPPRFSGVWTRFSERQVEDCETLRRS